MAGRIVGALVALMGVSIVVCREALSGLFAEARRGGNRSSAARTPTLVSVLIGLGFIAWGVTVAVTGDDLVRGN